MTQSLIFTFCILLTFFGINAQAEVWQPSPGHTQIPIWPGTVPDAQPIVKPENTKIVRDHLVAGKPWIKVSNVARPTLTVYSPKEKNTGIAVVVFPGGGYEILAIDLEGTEVCDWLTSQGVTCVLSKYRVPGEGLYPKSAPYPKSGPYPQSPMALEDAQRTVGLVRFHATEWHIDPHKIGVLGFSAGGHLVAAISTHFKQRLYKSVDAADHQSCRPDFAIAIYPGHLSLSDVAWDKNFGKKLQQTPTPKINNFELNPDVPVTKQTPPTFLLQAENDHEDNVDDSLVYYIALKNAQVPVEMHLYADGGHAFGLRRTKLPITEWPLLVETWLKTISGAFACDNQDANILNSQIQKNLNKDRIKYQLPALSVSIKIPGEDKPRNYVSGYYSLSDNKKITSDTLFQIGSITKTFTASIILRLVEENAIDLHQKIAPWFPQYPRWKNITVDNLLRHTSGVSNYTHGKNFDKLLRHNPHKYLSLDALTNLAYNQNDLSKPGEKYNYTNTDYVLLGMIIEKITHKSLQQIFDNYLHALHLTHTFYTPNGYSNPIINKIAHGYNRDGTFKFNEDVTFVSLSFGQSAGAIISTPNDLINWLDQLFTGKIISNKSLAKMMTVISEVDAKPLDLQKLHLPSKQNQLILFKEIGPGAGMGLVYFKNNGLVWAHAGGTPGYESFYVYDPCKNIYVVIMYNVKPKQQFIFAKIANNILDVLNKSSLTNNAIKSYQHNNLLPTYCRAAKEILQK